MRNYISLWIVGVESLDCRLHLRLADVAVVVEHLALEVGNVNSVEVDESYRPHSGEGQVDRYRRSQTARSDDQRLCVYQLSLSNAAHLGHDDVAAVPSHLVGS